MKQMTCFRWQPSSCSLATVPSWRRGPLSIPDTSHGHDALGYSLKSAAPLCLWYTTSPHSTSSSNLSTSSHPATSMIPRWLLHLLVASLLFLPSGCQSPRRYRVCYARLEGRTIDELSAL